MGERSDRGSDSKAESPDPFEPAGEGSESRRPETRPPSGELLERLSKHAPKETRYKLLGEVARGGMGAILRVWDEDLQRTLAMKVVLGKGEAEITGDTPEVDERTMGRFLDEAQVTGQLDHPNIVPVHELGVDANGRVYFTMRLVKGSDLTEVFECVEQGTEGWTRTRALEVLLKVCDAMAFSHDRNVVHRDLKPANVMVGRFGEVYVMDWGLARLLDQPDGLDVTPVPETPDTVVFAEARPRPGGASARGAEPSSLVTRDGDVLGTPYYMPPEQGRGELDRIGPASDVYSVGAMLYHLLTGCLPYSRPNERALPTVILARLLESPPPPVTEVREGIPPELVAICEKAMAREPEDRYPGMQALADDLRAFLDERVVRAYRTGALVEFHKWVKRNRATAGSLAALVLAVAGAGFALAWSQDLRYAEAAEHSLRQRSLLDSVVARDLVRSSAELDSDLAVRVTELEEWLSVADELLTRRSVHRTELESLERRGEPLSERDADETEKTDIEVRRDEFRTYLENAPGRLADPATTAAERASIEEGVRVLGYSMPYIERRAGRNELARLVARDYAFATTDDEREYQRLSELECNLVRLTAPEVGVLAGLRTDLADANRVREQLRDSAKDWERVRERVGLAVAGTPFQDPSALLAALDDLVPLGMNPDTGLWEFWHPASGARPAGSLEAGWSMAPESGLVFVLLPGGRVTTGTPVTDSVTSEDDERVHARELGEVTARLAPFLISKFELTQAQWLRAIGDIPSSLFGGRAGHQLTARITWTHPVENVSYEEAARMLALWDMKLPTELQWVYAASDATQRLIDAQEDPDAMSELVNLQDLAYAAQFEARAPAPFDDGFSVHAPVGSFLPDAFGLFDMQGNVCELTRDWFCTSLTREDIVRIEPDTGELVPSAPRIYRGFRGSSFMEGLSATRPTRRSLLLPIRKEQDVGFRPVICLPR